MSNSEVALLIRVPRALRRALKVTAAKQDITCSALITALLSEFVADSQGRDDTR